MFKLLEVHQVDIMLALSSICVIIAVFAGITKTLPAHRKHALLGMEISAAIWLDADRVAYIYRGMPGEMGFWVVRISNFFVFLMTIVLLFAVNQYLEDVFLNEGGFKKVPIPLICADIMAALAAILVCVSQFTGLYYTFDANNTYQRSPVYFLSYVFPYVIMMIQLAMIIKHRKAVRGKIAISLLLFDLVSLIASLIQFFAYGVSLVDMSAVVMVIGLYIFALVDMNERVEEANRIAINHLKNEQESMKRLFSQTATAMASAIDTRDAFTKDHSLRVAHYSKMIAERSGMDEQTCDEIYFTALLHDVGKIGSAEGEEHSAASGEILSVIKEYPFLSEGARHHHEHYDGSGHPDGLKGEEIPDSARIIAVADAYDIMTSKRSDHDPLPQATVRDEIERGTGTLYDPEFAGIMVEMIDEDTEYLMRQQDEEEDYRERYDLTKVSGIHFAEYKEIVSDGIKLSDSIVKIHLEAVADKDAPFANSIPAMILFDSFDGCVHTEEYKIRSLHYREYGEIWLDGKTVSTVARNMQTDIRRNDERSGNAYDIEAVKVRDHVKITIAGGGRDIEVITALPDSASGAYISFSGDTCSIVNVSVKDSGIKVEEGYIPRIAEEVSYTDRMEGDIPNLQIEDLRSAYTRGIPLSNDMRLLFHTMSLPTARLIWHCAYLLMYVSPDGSIGGNDYKEIACIRLDGENITKRPKAIIDLNVRKTADFAGWDEWKKVNKKGFDCEVFFARGRNRIKLYTQNCGISIVCDAQISDDMTDVYVALTGEQCALTEIRVI